MTAKLKKSKTLESYMGSLLLVAFMSGGILTMILTPKTECVDQPSKVSNP